MPSVDNHVKEDSISNTPATESLNIVEHNGQSSIRLKLLHKLILLLHNKQTLAELDDKYSLFGLVLQRLQEISFSVRTLANNKNVKTAQMASLHIDELHVELLDWVNFVLTYPIVMLPLVIIQSSFRRKILGEKVWEHQSICTWVMPANTHSAKLALMREVDEKELQTISHRDAKVMNT